MGPGSPPLVHWVGTPLGSLPNWVLFSSEWISWVSLHVTVQCRWDWIWAHRWVMAHKTFPKAFHLQAAYTLNRPTLKRSAVGLHTKKITCVICTLELLLCSCSTFWWNYVEYVFFCVRYENKGHSQVPASISTACLPLRNVFINLDWMIKPGKRAF